MEHEAHHTHEPHEEANPLQGYFDWQVTTLMLAYDLDAPLAGAGEDAVQKRRRQVEQEVREMVLALLPEKFKHDPELEWPPDLMMRITRKTLARAAEIARP